MIPMHHVHLRPFLTETGQFEKLVESGRTISSVLSPLDDSLAIYMRNTVCVESFGNGALSLYKK